MMQLFPLAMPESFVTVFTIVKNGGFESVKIGIWVNQDNQVFKTLITNGKNRFLIF